MLGRKTAAVAAIAFAAASSTETVAVAAVPPSLTVRLETAMVRGSLWNPWLQQNDPVELRSFRGKGIRDGDFVAPPIRVKPGQTLRVRLDNHLPSCTEAELAQGPCRNDTNLHTHGLWVSPTGHSDNVMIAIPPGGTFDYEFHIPDDHPAGTFWYHPHRHGSGMYQIASGMAGALIVEGDRLPTTDRPGDVDILLKDDRGGAFPEQVLVFQNIPYACAFEADGYRRLVRNREGKRLVYPLCRPDELGRVERFSQFVQPPDVAPAFSFFPLNGKVQPVLRGSAAGRFERWRIVNSGFHGLLRFGIRRLAPGAPELATVPGIEQPQWIERYCTGPPLPVWQIAHDGLTRSQIRRSEEAPVIPGGRLDLLTRFPEPGRYCLIEAPPPQLRTVSPIVLALVEVGGRPDRIADAEAELRRQLVRAAERALRGKRYEAVRSRVIADLENGLSLGSFVPHRTIAAAELTGRQTAEFRTEGPERNGEFFIDDRKFDHDRIDRRLPLGGVEEWRLHVPVGGGAHVFHIHVNPFQLVSAVNAKGQDVIDPASPGYNPMFAGLSGQWLDTVLLEPGMTVVTRTRYERFTGDIMLHCHLVAHSDLGMMQHVRIFAPGEAEPEHVHHGGD
jgi:FtsP/CotA-like multicopper oxidase with cupredoxin domain